MIYICISSVQYFNRKIYRHHYRARHSTSRAVWYTLQIKPASIDNCIMRACSTDDICTHATQVIHYITMEMKLFLVPLFYCPWFIAEGVKKKCQISLPNWNSHSPCVRCFLNLPQGVCGIQMQLPIACVVLVDVLYEVWDKMLFEWKMLYLKKLQFISVILIILFPDSDTKNKWNCQSRGVGTPIYRYTHAWTKNT